MNDAQTILVVEDDAGLRTLIGEACREAGQAVESVANGRDALVFVAVRTPLLMLLDYRLPDMTALEFVAELRRSGKAVPPFMVMTGAGSERAAVEIMKEGARDYLVKDTQFLESLTAMLGRTFRELDTERRLQETSTALQQQQETMVEVLNHLNWASTMPVLIGDVLRIIRQRTGLDAVGIRLREGDDYPYYVQEGFSSEFVRHENRLCACSPDGAVRRDEKGRPILECTCGLVLSGRTDPGNPLFTPNGSAWTNNSTLILDVPSDQDPRTNPRNRCVHEGYKSVALVPIRVGHEILGLLQLNDRRENRFSPEIICFHESLADSIGGAVARVQAQEAVRRERDRAQSYLDIAGVLFVALNSDQTVAMVNRRTCQTLGCEEKELLGKNWFDLCVPEHERSQIKTVFSRMIAGEIGLQEHYDNAIVTRGGEERMVAWHNSFLRGSDGKIVGTLSSGEDVTERRAAEAREKELQEKLNRATRMESLGVLAGGVAHDLNNVLSPVVALPDMVEEYLTQRSVQGDAEHAEVLEAVGVIRNSARRAAAVVNDLVVMGRRGQYQAECVDLNAIVRQTLSAKQIASWRTFRPEVGIVAHTSEHRVCCMGSESRLVRVALNLVGNAVEAIEGRGEVRLEVCVRDLAEPRKGHEDIPAGRYAVLSVADTGCGMGRETIDRIFEPFFTTKSPGERSGSGLGLSVVHGLVKDHKGFIDVHSSPGAGTTFVLYFPAVEQRVSGDSMVTKAEPARGSERVLVVDDEPAQLTVVRMVLGKLGFLVTTSETGRDAIRYFDKAKKAGEPAPFDLVIVDMRMRDVDGATLLEQMLTMYPRLKAIVSSGDAPDEWRRKVEKMGADWLGKPFLAADLSRAVREKLDRGSVTSDQ